MGLDMWLKAKTKIDLNTKNTGVCSDLFNISIKGEGLQEIGYWRKAFDQMDLMLKNYSGVEIIDDNEYLVISKEDVDTILEEAKEIYTTHKFDEEGYDITDEDEEECFICRDTWMSKDKWKDTIEFFTKAKEILEEDKDAKIYFISWY